MDDSEVKVFLTYLFKANELLQEKGAKKEVTDLLGQFIGGEFSLFVRSSREPSLVLKADSKGWETVLKILKGGNSNG